MSTAPGIGHNCARDGDTQRRYEANVIAISTWVGKRRIEEALTRQQLGGLTGLDRLFTLRNAALDGLHQLYLTNPGADVTPGLFALICIMSDNSQGCCSMSVSRMAQFLNRDRRNVGKAIDRLERDGCIKIDRQRSRDNDGGERAAGKAPLAWPIINPVYAEHRDPITWVLDAHAPTSRHIKRATQASQVDPPAMQPSQVETCDTAIARTCDTTVAHLHSTCDATIPNLRYRHPEPAMAVSHNTTSYTAKDSAKRTRGTRLPNDWVLPQHWAEWSRTHFIIPDAQLGKEAAAFRDYWHSQPGVKGTKVDWQATWRNWLRNSRAGYKQRAPERGVVAAGAGKRTTDPAIDDWRANRDPRYVVKEGC